MARGKLKEAQGEQGIDADELDMDADAAVTDAKDAQSTRRKGKVRPYEQRSDFEIGASWSRSTARLPAVRAVRILKMLMAQEEAREKIEMAECERERIADQHATAKYNAQELAALSK